MSESATVSVRLPEELDDLIAQEALRSRRSKEAVIVDLTDEALRVRMFPGIAFRGKGGDRRAWVIGTGLDVWELVEIYQDFGSVESVIEAYELTEPHIRLALAYYERFPADIDEFISQNRLPIERLRELYPEIEAREAST